MTIISKNPTIFAWPFSQPCFFKLLSHKKHLVYLGKNAFNQVTSLLSFCHLSYASYLQKRPDQTKQQQKLHPVLLGKIPNADVAITTEELSSSGLIV